MTTGEKIAKARRAQNITQEQLADLLQVSRQAVSRWESDIAYPETDNLVKLSKILGINCDYLLKEGVNEQGEKILEVKIVKEVPAYRQINFTFVFMAVFILAGFYLALFGTWNVVSELLKAAEARREAAITAAVGICGAVGYSLIAVGIKLLVSCIKKKQYFFKKTVEEKK